MPNAQYQPSEVPSLEAEVWWDGTERGSETEGSGEGKHRVKEAFGRSALEGQGTGDCIRKKSLSPERQRQVAEKVVTALRCSGRKACHWLGFNRSTLRYEPKPVAEKKRMLEDAIVEMSLKYPTEGYKKVWGQLRSSGYRINRKQVQRVRREEGLQVPPPPPKVRRRGLSTGLPQKERGTPLSCSACPRKSTR